jgi:hypothetical protein
MNIEDLLNKYEVKIVSELTTQYNKDIFTMIFNELKQDMDKLISIYQITNLDITEEKQ